MAYHRQSWVMAAAAFLSVGLACGTASANPTGVTYLAAVKTSFGTKFKDCYAFDSSNTLTVTGLGALEYQLLGFGSGPGRFEAVAPISLATQFGFAISFSGYAFGNADHGALHAVGINQAGDTYEIHGYPVTTCTVNASIPGSLYQPPQ